MTPLQVLLEHQMRYSILPSVETEEGIKFSFWVDMEETGENEQGRATQARNKPSCAGGAF